jgi:hypothetical protein
MGDVKKGKTQEGDKEKRSRKSKKWKKRWGGGGE